MMDFIKSSLGQLATRVVFARTFQWGAYAAVLAVLFTLASKLVTPGFSAGGGSAFGGHHSSFIPYLFIIIGLLIGAIMGLFNRPTLLQTAIFLDEKLGGKNYLATLVECSAKPRPNDVEAMLNQPPKNDIIPAAEHLRIPYNYAYFIIFLSLVMGLMIIQQTPLPAIISRTEQPRQAQMTLQASNLKSDIQSARNSASTESARKLLDIAEKLAKDIEAGIITQSVLLEKVNEFNRIVDDSAGSTLTQSESVRLKELLARITGYYNDTQVGERFTRADDNSQPVPSSGTDRGKDTATTPVSGGETTGVPVSGTGYTITSPAWLQKAREEALRKPYWPPEYNEVIEKYFSNQ